MNTNINNTNTNNSITSNLTKEVTVNRNHTVYPKSIPVECVGYTNKEGHKAFAEGHTPVFFRYPQDVNTVRCEACRKAYARVRSKSSSSASRVKRAQRVREAQMAAAKAHLANVELMKKLTAQQKAQLSAIADGKF